MTAQARANESARIAFRVNGEARTVETDPSRPLLEVLREDLGLTGAKYGCGESQCGACSVLLDGRRVFSCVTPASKAEGASIRTVEGLAAKDGTLHLVQQAFLDEGAYQCGYCTPGMILTAVALLEGNPRPTDEEIVEGMNRNLCRCGSYAGILRALRRAAGRKEG